MKHARAVAKAAAISLAFIALSNGADAVPLNGAWSGVPSSVNPATGAVTRTVTANAAALRMTVRWQCGQPTLCVVTGDQVELAAYTHLMVPPRGAVTPAPLFVLTQNRDCVARYGSTARIGAWITNGGSPVVQQCFTVTPPLSIGPRPDLPPIRLGPINLPRSLREPTGDQRPVPRDQLPPGTRPRP